MGAIISPSKQPATKVRPERRTACYSVSLRNPVEQQRVASIRLKVFTPSHRPIPPAWRNGTTPGAGQWVGVRHRHLHTPPVKRVRPRQRLKCRWRSRTRRPTNAVGGGGPLDGVEMPADSRSGSDKVEGEADSPTPTTTDSNASGLQEKSVASSPFL